ncbi:MAG TPA: peptide deformylase [Bacteroidales bacterium]|jgi:peptide deformylase|nr:peptide deformylase [Bacteroidales bacterium]
MMRLSRIIICIAAAIAAAATLFSCSDGTTFTASEKELIGSDTSAAIMPLYTTDSPSETELLRQVAAPLTAKDVASDVYRVLRHRMLCTVNDPENEGVGIAAPQVGISRQLIAVQRFDKEGSPFEFYPNAVITFYSPEKKYGWEGCLSVPEYRDTVLRSTSVVISYNDELTFEPCTDTISGFTAVIFQHETDHLKGVLYIDY